MKRCFGFAWHVMRLVIFFSGLSFASSSFYSTLPSLTPRARFSWTGYPSWNIKHTIRVCTLLQSCSIIVAILGLGWFEGFLFRQNKYTGLITLTFISFKTGFKVLSNSVHMASWKIDTCVCKMQIFAILYETNSK